MSDEKPGGTKTDGILVEHWCQHPGCKKWGSFGFDSKDSTDWFCMEHRPVDMIRPQDGP